MDIYTKAEIVSLKNHLIFNEKWVQAKIAEDPSILGLGELLLKDSERIQSSGGRLDLLLHDPESKRRYEVELQLGKTDESHIIRTIEYWDYERRKFPQYEHCAVIVAEEITSRFLNVISLFNGQIPLIAIQMKAIRIEDKISLFFTTILNEFSLGIEEEDESEPVDNKYWELKASKESLNLADETLNIIRDFAPGYNLNYTKHYIGVASHGISQNFILFYPRKNSTIILCIKHEPSEEINNMLESSNLDSLPYDSQWNQFRIRLRRDDLNRKKQVLHDIIKKAFDAYMK